MREHNSNNWNSIPEVYFISGQIKYIIQYKAGRVWYNKTVRLKSSAASWQYLWGYVHGYMARLQQRPNCLVAFRSTWGLKSHRTKNEYIRRLPPTSSQRGHVHSVAFLVCLVVKMGVRVVMIQTHLRNTTREMNTNKQKNKEGSESKSTSLRCVPPPLI